MSSFAIPEFQPLESRLLLSADLSQPAGDAGAAPAVAAMDAPSLDWSTYLGGADSETASDVAVDKWGNVFITGTTESPGWTSGGFDTSFNGGTNDVYVAKFSPTGVLLWSTYLGGTGTEYADGMAVDDLGNVLVTGHTYSSGWVSGGFDTSFGSTPNGYTSPDAFVVKLSPAGEHLWSTYLGGDGLEFGRGIAVDSQGNVLVTGQTASSGWTSGGYDTSFGGDMYDAFVAKLSPAGEHLWSTYLGGSGDDYGNSIAVDGSDNVLISGNTYSSGWTSGGYDTSFGPGGDDYGPYCDGFVAKLSPAGGHIWSTYVGSTLNDYARDIAVDGLGDVLVTGYSTRTYRATYETWITEWIPYVTKLTSTGRQVWFNTDLPLGGGWGVAITVDSSNNVLVAGQATSTSSMSGGFDTSYNGGSGDAFVMKLTPTGSHLWSTYLGESDNDAAGGIALDGSGNILVAGGTSSLGWVSGGSDTSYNGGRDGFVAKIHDIITPDDPNTDPDSAWSTYLGGALGDVANDIVVDSSGNIFVVGTTSSPGWVRGGYDSQYKGGYSGQDIFVAKLSPTGAHLWSTYLGGINDDTGAAITLDSQGNVLVTGKTQSSGWTSGGYDTSMGGDADAFVVKLSPTGAHLWSTYLGGIYSEGGGGIAVDGSDNVLVTGSTTSMNWVSGGFDTKLDGSDGFVVMLSPTGGHLWSTYLGGSASEWGAGIVTDSVGNILVVGNTQSSGWASGGFDTSYGGKGLLYGDAFVAKLSPTGAFLWSTYLGGTSDDSGCDIAVDGSDNILVTGNTMSSGWTSGGYDTSYNGGDPYVMGDAFVAKLSPTGGQLWSTYVGGTSGELGNGIAVDGSGNILIVGNTDSTGWASGGADTSHNGGRLDAFVVRLSPTGDQLWSSYLGGTGSEYGNSIVVDGSGNILAAGTTGSVGWASGGFDTSFNGGDSSYGDAFVAKMLNKSADANFDGQVDVGDLGILGANYGTTSGANWSTGDFTGDGKVDVGDLGVLGANYGSSGAGAALVEQATDTSEAPGRVAAEFAAVAMASTSEQVEPSAVESETVQDQPLPAVTEATIEQAWLAPLATGSTFGVVEQRGLLRALDVAADVMELALLSLPL